MGDNAEVRERVVVPGLSDEELREVVSVLTEALSDLSMEISSTDNAGYRAGFKFRRDRLASATRKLARLIPAA
jgi:hypothetical protein